MKLINTDTAPSAVGPYSQAAVAGGLVYCSGQIEIDPITNSLISGDAAAQTTRILQNLEAVLTAAGSSLAHVVRATIFLTDMDDFAAINTVYANAFGTHRPARACVEVSRLPKNVRVEIDAIAVVSE